MTSESLKGLQNKFPHWANEIGKLHRLFKLRATSLYIPGPQCAEKSYMLRELLSLCSIRVAYVRGSETYWSRNLFFERILLQLKWPVSGPYSHSITTDYNSPILNLPTQKNGYLNVESCGNTALFIEKVKSYFLTPKSSQASPKTSYILIEDIDKLDSKVFGENILAVLLRLEELTSVPIGVIMTGSCDWNDLQPEFAVQPPSVLHLRSPNADELISMLKESDIALPKKTTDRIQALHDKYQAEGSNVEGNTNTLEGTSTKLDTRHWFKIFVPIAVHSLRLAYPSKNELLYIIMQMFPRYLEPLIRAMENETELPANTALYASISPYFATAINCPSIMMLAWIAARNPTIDIEIKNRKRVRKSNVSLAARLEEDMFDPPSSWRLDKLLSILDHLLAGNEEAEEINDVETADDEAFFKRLHAQVMEAQSDLKSEESVVDPNATSTPNHLWSKAEFNDTSISFDNAMNASPMGSQSFSDGISWGYTSEEATGSQSALPKPFESSTLFPLLWEAHANHTHQLEILTQIGVLEQLGLFIRSSALTSNTSRSRAEYRCGFDASFAHLVADSINFPLWGFL